MVFSVCAFLYKDFSLGIEYEYGEGSVKRACPVCLQFLHRSNGTIVLVDEDHVIHLR